MINSKDQTFPVIIGNRLMLASLFLNRDITRAIISCLIRKATLKNKRDLSSGMGVRGNSSSRCDTIKFRPPLIIIENNITFEQPDANTAPEEWLLSGM